MAVAQCLAMILNYLLLYSVRETFVFHVINMYLRHSTNYQSKTKNACLSYLHDLLLLLIQVMDFISCSYNWTLTCMAAQQNDSKIRLHPQAPVLMYSGIIFEIYPPPDNLIDWISQMLWQYTGSGICTTTLYFITKFCG